MSIIDIGDLLLSQNAPSLQQALFDAVQKKIIDRNWIKGSKLPSTRKMAEELSVSRNTVTSAYEQLVAEGYLESRKGSGFYVSVTIPEHFLKASIAKPFDSPPTRQFVTSQFNLNQPFSAGVPDLQLFPYAKWQRLLQRHTHRSSLSGISDIQGYHPLREALCNYLQSSRSLVCRPDQIIITSGAQQALSIATLAIREPTRPMLMEEPGYTQMRKILNLYQVPTVSIPVVANAGLDIESVLNQNASAIYLTPSNQYPMGTSLNTEQRLQILQWAEQNQSWIIEDDYDSEFQFAHRPYTSLQGLSNQSGFSNRCIYVGSFSKTMFNGLRIGYLVAPDSIIETCLEIKSATGGSTAIHAQAALSDFIDEGHFLRHLRKMRKIYQKKSELMQHALSEHFGHRWQIVSQAAGLHTTVRWFGPPDETCVSSAAKKIGITARPLSYYEQNHHQREWNGLVLGYGNVDSKQIDPLIWQLKQLYQQLNEQESGAIN